MIVFADDEVLTKVLEADVEELRAEGFEVEAVRSTAAVLPRLRSLGSAVELLLLDVMMPIAPDMTKEETFAGTMTGIALLGRIRREYPLLPVVLITVKQRHELKQAMEQYGVSAYLSKPYEPEDLVALVKRVLSERQNS